MGPMTPIDAIMSDTLMAGSKRNKLKKRHIVLDERALYVFVDDSRTQPEEVLLLVFCFVRAPAAADDTGAIAVYNKERELYLSDSDSARLAAWASAISSAADASREAELGEEHDPVSLSVNRCLRSRHLKQRLA